MSAEELQLKAYELDAQKFDFEKERQARDCDLETKQLAFTHEIEQKKLDLEKRKAKWTAISVFVTALSILGSVTVAGFTILESQRLQNQAAETQFALKAADLVLQSDDPEVNENKKIRFEQLFPDRVPPMWANNFDWRKYAVESDEMKREVAKLLTEHPAQAPQIIALYKTLFTDDPTVQSFLARIQKTAPHK
jgi:hypothetical protein